MELTRTRTLKLLVLILTLANPSNEQTGTANSSSENRAVKKSSTAETTQSTISGWVPISLELSISIDLEFTEALTDPSSPEYIRLKTETLKVVRETFNTFPGFVGVMIKGFRKGSVVVDFFIEIESDRNLTAEAGSFRNTLIQLQTATIEGNTVNVDVTVVMNNFTAVAEAMDHGGSCDPTQCTSGHFCNFQRGTFVCLHKCELVTSLCYNRGGCLYDSVLDEPVCRCQRESKLQNACSDEGSVAGSESNVAAIVGGVLGSLTLIGFTAAVIIWYFRKQNEDDTSSQFTIKIKCCYKCNAGCSGTQFHNQESPSAASNTSSTEESRNQQKSTKRELEKEKKRAINSKGKAKDTNGDTISTIKEFRWEYRDNKSTWNQYGSSIDNKLTEAFNKKEKQVDFELDNGELMSVLFEKGVQKNKKTGWERLIRIAVKDDLDGLNYVWEWKDEEGNFNPYGPQNTLTLETARKNQEETVDLKACGRSYKINVQKMEQTNIATSATRKVQRKQSRMLKEI